MGVVSSERGVALPCLAPCPNRISRTRQAPRALGRTSTPWSPRASPRGERCWDSRPCSLSKSPRAGRSVREWLPCGGARLRSRRAGPAGSERRQSAMARIAPGPDQGAQAEPPCRASPSLPRGGGGKRRPVSGDHRWCCASSACCNQFCGVINAPRRVGARVSKRPGSPGEGPSRSRRRVAPQDTGSRV